MDAQDYIEAIMREYDYLQGVVAELESDLHYAQEELDKFEKDHPEVTQ